MFVYLDAPMSTNIAQGDVSTLDHRQLEINDVYGLKSLSHFLKSRLPELNDFHFLLTVEELQ